MRTIILVAPTLLAAWALGCGTNSGAAPDAALIATAAPSVSATSGAGTQASGVASEGTGGSDVKRSPSGASIGPFVPDDFGFPDDLVINLQPTPDCKHPDVIADCSDEFCTIPPGCFIYGAPRDEFGAARNGDQQVQVTLTRAFELGKFEVTNRTWLAEGFDLPLRDQDVGVCRDPDCPISNVNLFEALTFANQYSEARGLPACYELRECSGTFGSGTICNRPGSAPGTLKCDRTVEDGLNCQDVIINAADAYACEGYRLPTEVEWEYAGRAGTRTAFWTGPITWQRVRSECELDAHLEPLGWYCNNSQEKQHVVGLKQPNPWGLFDMLGNVSEWIPEAKYWYGYDNQGPQVDPMGHWWHVAGNATRSIMPVAEYGGQLSQQTTMVNRGGNYLLDAANNSVSARSYLLGPHQGTSARGFRLARTL